MPDNSSLLPMDNSVVINLISEYVYQAILTTHQRHPEWLHERFRKYAWTTAEIKGKFTSKLVEELSKFEERLIWRQKVFIVLQNSLSPSFFSSLEFVDLVEKIQRLTPIEAQIAANEYSAIAALNSHLEGKLNSQAAAEPSIAILLLDAENLYLNWEIEKFLASVCRCPLQIKIAFGNWQHLGKKDKDLHNRGYELIHVPAGKDSADFKMATVGSSIFIHYPTAKEVLVCSSDSVLSHLCNTLQTHGLTVYSVSRQGDNITVFNNRTGEIKNHTCVVSPEVPSLKESIDYLKAIIRLEQARSGSVWIPLEKIPNWFNTKYDWTIEQIISIHCPGKQLIDILTERATDFAIHSIPNNSKLYVTLFQTSRSRTPTNNNSPEITPAKEPSPSSIDSPVKLEEELIKIVQNLTAKSPSKFISLGTLGTEFNKQYGQPLSKVMSNLGLGKKLPKFFESCSAFELRQTNTGYELGIGDRPNRKP
jgi:hypothetical protein